MGSRSALALELGRPLPVLQPIQPEEGGHLAVRQDRLRRQLPQRRRQLEAVAGAATEEPDVVPLRVPVEHEMTVGAVLVLADLGAEDWGPGQLGEAGGQEGARVRDRFLAGSAVPAGRVERHAARVVGDLEPGSQVGRAVEDALAEVEPYGEAAGDVAVGGGG